MASWYMGVYNGDQENAYEKFLSDEEAIRGLSYSDNGAYLLEVYECADDECLTPIRQIQIQ